MRSLATCAVGLMILQGCVSAQAPLSTAIPTYGFTITATYPHDPAAFTQGLQYLDGFLYEGTGLNGRSSIRKVKLETGAVLQKRDIPAEYFGEGVTIWKSTIIQLTWQSGIAFAYDVASFAPLRTFKYSGEGWGLTHDTSDLVMSDGTSDLRFLAPETFIERRRLRVTADGKPVVDLNELEFVRGEIYANVWQTDRIARIDPKSGKVTGWIDLTGLLPQKDRATDAVLNGIAYDASGDRLFVTGKLWPKLYQIRLTAPPRGR